MSTVDIVFRFDAGRRPRTRLLSGLAVSATVHILVIALALSAGFTARVRPAVTPPTIVARIIMVDAREDASPPAPTIADSHASKPSLPSPAPKRSRTAVATPVAVDADARSSPIAPMPVIAVPASEAPALQRAPAEISAAATPSAQRSDTTQSDATVPPSFKADYLDNPAPSYPAASRRLREQGRVTLLVEVETDGTPREVNVATSSGSARLDQAALDAVKRWRFAPARRGSIAIPAQVLVPIVFELTG